MTANYCSQCGNHLEKSANFCDKCGVKTEPDISSSRSKKSAGFAFFLCLFFGMLGFHRFYVGKFGTGLLMLLTAGGFGIWMLIDLIFIINNKFEDKNGNTLLLTTHPSGFKKAMLAIVTVIAWFLIYVAIILTLVIYLTRGLVDTVINQLSALRENNIEKAYSYTSKDFQKVTSLEDFKKYLDQYPSLKNNSSVFFTDRELKNNTGYLEGTLTATDGAKTHIKYLLIKEDNAWKILGMTLSPVGADMKTN